ncbi:conjugal transfer protein TraF [Aquabacterium sp.]|uniref:conjugal transfer protein TraF n=1 Tax=Aquabacterium sp. TaxID=1872578 RepID=UPI002E34F4C7|nr:conjugal transfer protein TraF [Aquabacterium sp.]HEX5311212.1 conjugal transfer protein TraF [Aquabacterium sp.]
MVSRSNICIAIGALLAPTLSLAAPFTPFEARGFAMGGAGVASSEHAAASLYNPALLAIKSDTTRFSFIAPSVGIRATGNDGAVKSVQDFNDNGSIDGFDSAATNFSNQLDRYLNSHDNAAAFQTSAQNLKTASDQLLRDLNAVNQKAFQLGAGGTLALAIPRWEYKAAFSVSNETFARITTDVAQSDLNQIDTTITNIVDATNEIIANNNTNGPKARQVIDSNGDLILGNGDLQSKAHVLGVSVTDIGVSMARELTLQDQTFMVGITPKIQQVTTVATDTSVDADSISLSKNKKSYTSVNLDVGIAKQFEQGQLENVRVGLVVRNLIPHTYKTFDVTQDVKMAPQLRVGAAYTHKFFTVTSDLDLTSNKVVGQGSEASQIWAIGGELNAWSVAKIRAGYRNDFKAKYGTVTAGLSLFGVQLSAAYAKDREISALLQFGGSF